jgi:hypothetical protein
MLERRPEQRFTVERKRVFRDAEGRAIPNISRIGPASRDDGEDGKRTDGRRAMSANDLVTALQALAERARRLRPPMASNPDAFHEDKSELARDINKLADAIRVGPARADGK